MRKIIKKYKRKIPIINWIAYKGVRVWYVHKVDVDKKIQEFLKK